MKRFFKVSTLFLSLCMLCAVICSCAASEKGFAITTNELTGRVTAIKDGNLTLAVGTQGGRGGSFPNDFDGDNMQGSIPAPPDGNMPGGGMPVPPDGNNQPNGAPPAIPDFPGDSSPSDDAASSGFTEQENRESGFGGGKTDGGKGDFGSYSFRETGVSITLALAKGVKTFDETGAETEIQVGDIVRIVLDENGEISQITVLKA